MTTRFALLTIARLVAVGATLVAIGCADSSTAPTITRSIQSSNRAAHDDPPPDTKCASGWTQVDGRWVCEF